jgi:hypothetical protein
MAHPNASYPLDYTQGPGRTAADGAKENQGRKRGPTPRSARLPANEIRELAHPHSACTNPPKIVNASPEI